jgi:hypothetical protein
VGQSGISKQLDVVNGHKLLASIAKSIAKAERQLAEYAAMVLRNAPIEREERERIRVVYPARFELFAATELIDNLTKLQVTLKHAGEAPNTEREILQAIVRQTLLGLTDAEYDRLDAEIELMVRTKSRLKEPVHDTAGAGVTSHVEAMEGEGSAEQAAGEDPTGQSGGTLVGNMIPSVM